MSYDLIVEDLSGEIQSVEVSAETGSNIDKLLEAIVLQAELSELKTNNETFAEATVIEANVDKGRGPLCNIIVTNGKLKVGDIAVAGSEYGKVRAILNDKGQNLTEAVSSMPVQVLGLNEPPEAGDSFVTVESDEKARELCEIRSQIKKNKVLPKNVINRISVEAGTTIGWTQYVGNNGVSIGIDHFGESAPGEVIMEKKGFSVENICNAYKKILER